MSLLADAWNLLDANSKPIGALSSVVFGISSAAIAITALWVAYRNNFGWKPIVLIISYGLRGGGGFTDINCKFEIWNRRKYPVLIREMQIHFGQAKIDWEETDGFAEGETWYATKEGGLVSRKSISVEPGKREVFEVAGPMSKHKNLSISKSEDVKVWVDVFDPKSNSHEVISIAAKRKNSWWNKKAKRQMPSYSSYRSLPDR